MCTSRLAAPLDITADDHLDDTATALSTVKLTPPLHLRLPGQLRHGDTQLATTTAMTTSTTQTRRYGSSCLLPSTTQTSRLYPHFADCSSMHAKMEKRASGCRPCMCHSKFAPNSLHVRARLPEDQQLLPTGVHVDRPRLQQG